MEPGSIFLILETQGTPIGFVRLQDGGTDSCLKGSTEWNSLHAMELSRIYLLPAWTGHRLGDVLMQACIDYARSRGVEVLWLGVWEHNPHAIAFYQRWGFMKIGSHISQLGQDSQTDFVMARRI
jgi:ribosomal protein S18 acetylase RimI-like enzyme